MLRESLSPLESSMRQMGELLDAEQEEITFLLNELGKIYNRLYVKSADITGIRYWEDEYAIPHNDDLTIEQRRARVLAKINSSITATKKMLEDLVKQVLGANSVTIIEYPDEYRFVIYVDTKIFEENIDVEKFVEDNGLGTVSDESVLRETIEKVIRENPQSVADYQAGKKKAIGFLVGQTMRVMKGKANPELVNKILQERLE